METYRVADGVHGIDVGLHDEQVSAAHVVAAEEPLVVEPGHPKGLDRLLAGLEQVGVAPADVEHVLSSHVHVDHAGAAAGLAEHAPDATVHHHAASADHLLDPTALVESTREVLGEAFEDLGEPLALPESRLDRIEPPTTLELGDRAVEVLAAPGHSGDNVAAYLPEPDVLFAAESAVNYYPRSDAWFPPATVPTFDPDAVAETIDRLADLDAETVALTHYGVVEPDQFVERARERLATFRERVPALYDEHNEDLGATEAAVLDELLGLAEYDETIRSVQASVQTRGFLLSAGRL